MVYDAQNMMGPTQLISMFKVYNYTHNDMLRHLNGRACSVCFCHGRSWGESVAELWGGNHNYHNQSFLALTALK